MTKHNRIRRRQREQYLELLRLVRSRSGWSLQQIEKADWGDPETAPTGVIERVLMARRMPIGEMDLFYLRCLIGQDVGMQYLVPRAMDVIEVNPLEETRYYPGDLICSLLGCDPQFWINWPDLRDRLFEVIERLHDVPSTVAKDIEEFRSRMLIRGIGAPSAPME